MRVLIVGYGYVGSALGLDLVKRGHRVVGLRRTAGPVAEVNGVKVLVADVSKTRQVPAIGREYDWVVFCAAAGGGGEAEYESVYLNGNRNLLEWFGKTSGPPKYVYTSSTSVYGQDDGSSVDEQSPVEPPGATGRVLLESENVVLREGRERGVPTLVLRLAGIYGPGRGYWFRQFVNGQAAIDGSGQRFLNMVHRDDVAGAIIAALERGRPGEVYNVVDDEPVTQLAFFEWLANELGKPLPPHADESERTRKRGASNKRVSNRKLKTELGYRFRFATFREGYADEVRRLTESADSK